jgi:hypothetical protein
MNGTKRRGWLAALLAFFLLLLVVWVVAVFQLSPAAAGGGQLGVALRSGLAADYGSEPIRRIVRSLRISVVADLMRDLGMSDAEAGEAMHAMKVAMSSPVPTATARNFDGDDPYTATPTKTPRPTETPEPTATRTHRPPTRTPEPTKTDRPRHHPSMTPTPAGGPDVFDPEIDDSSYTLDPDPGALGCSVEWTIENLEVFDPAPSSGIEWVKLKYEVDGYSDFIYSDELTLVCGEFDGDGNWLGCYAGTHDLEIFEGWVGEENDEEGDFVIRLWAKALDYQGHDDILDLGTYTMSDECDDPD